jgi:hypothetical protein
MGICIKDHPEEDILEKLEEVREQLTEELIHHIVQGLHAKRWEQPTQNGIFHLLKKLEKKITEQEKAEVLVQLQNF